VRAGVVLMVELDHHLGAIAGAALLAYGVALLAADLGRRACSPTAGAVWTFNTSGPRARRPARRRGDLRRLPPRPRRARRRAPGRARTRRLVSASSAIAPRADRDQGEDHVLLDGRTVQLGSLAARERAFLADLGKMKRQGVDYFEIYRTALGPGSPALEGRNRVDRRLVETPFYQVAEDIVTRAGIEQGLIVAPEYEEEWAAKAPRDFSMISVTQAATLIGITRAAVYKAIEKKAIAALHIGNVTVVNRASAVEYKRGREAAEASRPAKPRRRSQHVTHP